MIREAIVLAGGFGTRLQKVVSEVPKPMAPVAGKPFLQYILDYLIQHKVNHAVLAVGYLHETIINFFGDIVYDFDSLKNKNEFFLEKGIYIASFPEKKIIQKIIIK